MATWEAERFTCPQCHGPLDECADPDRDWFPQRSLCYKTMAAAAANAAYAEKHKAKPYHDGTFTFWHTDYTSQTPFRYDDGATVWVSEHDLTPDDDFI